MNKWKQHLDVVWCLTDKKCFIWINNKEIFKMNEVQELVLFIWYTIAHNFTLRILAFISSGEQFGSPPASSAISSVVKSRCRRVTCQASVGTRDLGTLLWEEPGVVTSLLAVDNESLVCGGSFLVFSNIEFYNKYIQTLGFVYSLNTIPKLIYP